jgi:AcrR family transcriptional regulator
VLRRNTGTDVTVSHMVRPPSGACPDGSAPSVLTPDAIAEAALRVIREGGPQALSFRRVAALLDTSHMTVHRRCHNLDGLLAICAEHLAATLPEVDAALPWAQATELRFASLYDVLSANSALVALQQGSPWLGPEMTRRFSEPAMASSLAAGLSVEEMIQTHRGLWSFTVGCALTFETYDIRRGRALLDDLDAEQTPVLAEHRDRIAVDHVPREVFLRGVRALIAAADPDGGRPRLRTTARASASRGRAANAGGASARSTGGPSSGATPTPM